MKRLFFVPALLLLMALFTGCPPGMEGIDVSVSSVSLSSTSVSLAVNKTKQLIAIVLPTSAPNKKVTWSSNSPGVATVSATGLVTAKAIGSTTITAKTEDGGKIASCAVTVTNENASYSYKLSNNTKVIEDNWDTRISGAVTENVINLSSTSGISLPKVGDILIKETATVKFPKGYLGKVVSVTPSGAGVKIVTESVDLEDAFDELIISINSIDISNYISGAVDEDGNPLEPVVLTKGSVEYNNTYHIEGTIKPKNSSSSLTGGVVGTLGFGVTFNYEYNKPDGKPKEYEELSVKLEGDFSAGIWGGLEESNSTSHWGQVKVYTYYFTPIPVAPFIVIVPEIPVYFGLDCKGKISVQGKVEYKPSIEMGYKQYGKNDPERIYEREVKNEEPFSANISIEGRLGVGVVCELRATVNGAIGPLVKGKVSLGIDGEFKYDLTKAFSGGLYQELKDTKLKQTLVTGVGVGLVAKIPFTTWEWEWAPEWEEEYVLAEQPLLPDFSNMKKENGGTENSINISYEAHKNTIIKGYYGIYVYDELEQIVKYDYYESIPLKTSELPVPIPFTVNVPNGKTYKVYPVFKLGNTFEFIDKETIIALTPSTPPPFPGTVTFATPQEWTVSGNGITQIWSDAVEASGANKTDFNGGTYPGGPYLADGRNNPGQKGNLFSWLAVALYKDLLCPLPWHIPTKQDFIDLDMALGGTGENRDGPGNISFINETYLSPTVWGGAFGGLCDGSSSFSQGSGAYYWSRTPSSLEPFGEYLLLSAGGSVRPQDYQRKVYGFTIRCVRPAESSGIFPGTVTFATSQEWTVSGNGVNQIWSDAVEASGANKTTFNGDTADGRNNPGYKGHLFSWYAVDQYKNQLCPAPWRIPTRQDFIDLDKALGGTGSNHWMQEVFTKYLNQGLTTGWGGAYGGSCISDGTFLYKGSLAYYWSQSEHSLYNGYGLYLNPSSSGFVYPQNAIIKNAGLTLRCVR
ncbi:MAG: Ig-like domain-containing protein [Prevotellaceae bacterium]|jgi:uncharacterized protein (TIGR02145 family)|nr:Ig-like domain-containing protein [Prevotellaceae bacterium]